MTSIFPFRDLKQSSWIFGGTIAILCIHLLFNAVDDYTVPELYDPLDKFNITEAQLRERAEDVLKNFEKKISS